jgi:hypothetical protein
LHVETGAVSIGDGPKGGLRDNVWLTSANLGHRRTDENGNGRHYVAMNRFFDSFDPSRRDWLEALLLGLVALAMPLSIAIRGFLLWLQS